MQNIYLLNLLVLTVHCTAFGRFFMDPDRIRIFCRSGFFADPDLNSWKQSPIRIRTKGPGSEPLPVITKTINPSKIAYCRLGRKYWIRNKMNFGLLKYNVRNVVGMVCTEITGRLSVPVSTHKRFTTKIPQKPRLCPAVFSSPVSRCCAD